MGGGRLNHPNLSPESQPGRAPQSGLKERTTRGIHQRQTHHLRHKVNPYLIRYSKPAQCTDRISTIGVSTRTWVQKTGNWTLKSDSRTQVEPINRDRLKREVEITGRHNRNIVAEKYKFSEGDMVLYKAHQLSKAHKGFHAVFAPK
jgi:hypothetical protein